MDWRGRKYYVARFSLDSYDMRVQILKNIEGVKLHSPTNCNFKIKLPDEKEPRGYYDIFIGCSVNKSEIVEFELRKAKRKDGLYTDWKEIERDNKRCTT